MGAAPERGCGKVRGRECRRRSGAARPVAVVLLAVSLWAGWGAVAAREPAVHVVEVAVVDEVPPPACRAVTFARRTLHLAGGTDASARSFDDTELVLALDLDAIEDADSAVLVRHAEGCALLLARGSLPPRQVGEVLALPLPPFDWAVTPDGRLSVRRAGAECVLARGGVTVLAESAAGIVRIAHYGILPLYGGRSLPSARAVGVGGAVSGRFGGPGDIRRYVLDLSRAGMLVVELRSDAGPGSVDVEIADKGGRIVGKGGAAFPGPGQVLVTLLYRGVGPAGFDAAFLFSPDPSLRCTLLSSREAGEVVDARLRLENLGDAPVTLWRPGPGTVRWYAGSELVAAAVPGAAPQRVLLRAGAAVDYSARLRWGGDPRRLRAEVDTGSGTLRCLRESGR